MGSHGTYIHIVIALKPPVWYTLSTIYCIEGPSEFSTQSAEVRLAVTGEQPLFTLGLPMFALFLVDFLSLLWSPSGNMNFFIFVQTIIWRPHTESSKNHVGLKLEWDWELLLFEVLFSCTFYVLLGATNVNMLVTTQCSLKRALHLTSHAWVCVVWKSESLLKLSALWIYIFLNYTVKIYIWNHKGNTSTVSYHPTHHHGHPNFCNVWAYFNYLDCSYNIWYVYNKWSIWARTFLSRPLWNSIIVHILKRDKRIHR